MSICETYSLKDPTHIKIQAYLEKFDENIKIIEFNKVSTKTSELAAEALGVEVGQIAKSLLFVTDTNIPVMIVTCGDMKIDQKKLKKMLQVRKVRFATEEQVNEITGYPIGGVCPLDCKTEFEVLLDESLNRFNTVYLAAGTPFSAIPITLEQLQHITKGKICSLSTF